MTWSRPSGRLIVPSLLLTIPGPAVGFVPFATTSGGQMLAHAPEQVTFVPLSVVMWYSVRPFWSTRILVLSAVLLPCLDGHRDMTGGDCGACSD